MNRWILALAVLVSCMSALWAADDEQERAVSWQKSEGFVAHEWGAIIQDQRHPYDAKTLESDLARTPAADCEGVVVEQVSMGMGGKPVLFFYTDAAVKADVSVAVNNPGNLMYHYPPAIRTVEMFDRAGRSQPRSLQLQWLGVEVAATGKTAGLEFANVPAKHWWSDCRKVQCSELTVDGKTMTDRPKEMHADGKSKWAEKFLFYDGPTGREINVGIAPGDAGLTVANNEQYVLKDVFVVKRDSSGVRWGYAEEVAAGAKVAVQWAAEADSFVQRFTRAQLDAGLYSDEAAAFWAAWDKQFYGNDGTRVIYRLEKKQMDQIMPLTVVPAPKKLVRVNWVCVGQ